MARYTGPRDKISRRFGVPLFGPSKALERRAYAPGMHGGKGEEGVPKVLTIQWLWLKNKN